MLTSGGPSSRERPRQGRRQRSGKMGGAVQVQTATSGLPGRSAGTGEIGVGVLEPDRLLDPGLWPAVEQHHRAPLEEGIGLTGASTNRPSPSASRIGAAPPGQDGDASRSPEGRQDEEVSCRRQHQRATLSWTRRRRRRGVARPAARRSRRTRAGCRRSRAAGRDGGAGRAAGQARAADIAGERHGRGYETRVVERLEDGGRLAGEMARALRSKIMLHQRGVPKSRRPGHRPDAGTSSTATTSSGAAARTTRVGCGGRRDGRLSRSTTRTRA